MTEYVAIGLMIALVVVFYIKKPSKTYGIFAKSLVAILLKNEGELVKGAYNSLPASIKQNVTSEQVAMIVSQVVNIAVELIEGSIEEGK